MTDTEQLFSELAETHLGIPTLKPRMSDALDFHTVAVWGVRAALTAAHRAGAATASQTNSTDENPGRFTAYEIHPCRRLRYDDEPDRAYVERCEPYEADFWTVFGLLADGLSMAVGDFATREHAEEILGRIAGGSRLRSAEVGATV